MFRVSKFIFSPEVPASGRFYVRAAKYFRNIFFAVVAAFSGIYTLSEIILFPQVWKCEHVAPIFGISNKAVAHRGTRAQKIP